VGRVWRKGVGRDEGLCVGSGTGDARRVGERVGSQMLLSVFKRIRDTAIHSD
jgi:hypothetical protein